MIENPLPNDQLARERRLFQKYPYHIYLMVKAAAAQLKAGKLKIVDGMLEPVEDEANKK